MPRVHTLRVRCVPYIMYYPLFSSTYSSLFTSLLHQRPDSATNWREFPSSSLNHFSPSLHRKTTQTSLDFPDLALTSRRLPVFNGASLATNSQHTMQDYIFRYVHTLFYMYVYASIFSDICLNPSSHIQACIQVLPPVLWDHSTTSKALLVY